MTQAEISDAIRIVTQNNGINRQAYMLYQYFLTVSAGTDFDADTVHKYLSDELRDWLFEKGAIIGRTGRPDENAKGFLGLQKSLIGKQQLLLNIQCSNIKQWLKNYLNQEYLRLTS